MDRIEDQNMEGGRLEGGMLDGCCGGIWSQGEVDDVRMIRTRWGMSE